MFTKRKKQAWESEDTHRSGGSKFIFLWGKHVGRLAA
jgi:hypothetical protein